jgi:hypothetical protein
LSLRQAWLSQLSHQSTAVTSFVQALAIVGVESPSKEIIFPFKELPFPSTSTFASEELPFPSTSAFEEPPFKSSLILILHLSLIFPYLELQN